MNEQAFIDFFASLFDDSISEELTLDTEFRYLDEWSSLTGFYFISDMKEKYNKTIEIPEFKACETIGDLYTLYKTK